MRSNPARYFRASLALGVVAAGLLVPAAADAQMPMPSTVDPAFTKTVSVDSGNGPLTFLLHGAFDDSGHETVVGVSDSGQTTDGVAASARLALFSPSSTGLTATRQVALDGQMPIAAVAADIDGTGPSVVVASKGGGGRLESYDWRGTGTPRITGLDDDPAGLAVGRFLPGHGTVVAVSLPGDQLAFYEATANGFTWVDGVSGVTTGPLAVGPRPGQPNDFLVTTGSSLFSGRVVAVHDGDTSPRVQEIEASDHPFGTSSSRIAQDLDAFGFRWYAWNAPGSAGLSWVSTANGSTGFGGSGIGTPSAFGTPVVLDLFGRGTKDSVAALDGTTVATYDNENGTTGSAPLDGGTAAAAVDVDGDRRDDLVVAHGSWATLFHNETGGEANKPALLAEALTPSVFDGAREAQVVTARSFDFRVPTDTGDEYQCAVGDDAAWQGCSGTDTAALSVDADGPHVLRVRRKAQGTTFWSAEQRIDFVVDASRPADPVITDHPAPATAWPSFWIGVPAAGTTVQYRVDGAGEWLDVTDGRLVLSDLTEGPHAVAFRSIDDVRGVASEKSPTFEFVVDRTGPVAPTRIAGPEATTWERTATIAFEGEPDGRFECLIDKVEPQGAAARTPSLWEACSSPLELRDLALGDHTVTVRQVDAAGNRGKRTTWTWTVVEKPAEPVAETPAPAAPAKEDKPSPVATTPAPAPAPKPAEAEPVKAKLSVGAPAGKGKSPVATATGRRVAVGCAAPGAEGYRCAVTVTRNGRTVGGGRRAGAGLVPVDLDKATAKRVQRLGGLKVRVLLTVTTPDGETTKAAKTVRVLPRKVVVVPTDGLFAFASAAPTRGADALAKDIAGQLDGARTITIVGHTDAVGSADVNRRLGQRRAEAFRRLLARHGFDGEVRVTSAGDTQPRASNATAGGRALNRRVEIDVRY